MGARSQTERRTRGGSRSSSPKPTRGNTEPSGGSLRRSYRTELPRLGLSAEPSGSLRRRAARSSPAEGKSGARNLGNRLGSGARHAEHPASPCCRLLLGLAKTKRSRAGSSCWRRRPHAAASEPSPCPEPRVGRGWTTLRRGLSPEAEATHGGGWRAFVGAATSSTKSGAAETRKGRGRRGNNSSADGGWSRSQPASNARSSRCGGGCCRCRRRRCSEGKHRGSRRCRCKGRAKHWGFGRCSDGLSSTGRRSASSSASGGSRGGRTAESE